ncbi:hypothetical protein [Siminovitchia fordii]|uniref:Uncharacterized protein n=1 Tax=Siminovitchia fordii TaxID=254759 RepID=A0ABQ4KBM4_9BACI|nr:hypothetical protein [Siminovitchia fordii]GIN23134.1 hypothetical protein J1TS3_42680 [Siminovitchia fordii]
MSTDINERVGVIESTLKNHEQRLQKQESNNEILIEMKTILKNQVEMNKEQNEQMREFSGTLIEVNNNLSKLNGSQEQLQNDMGKIGERVTHIEKSQDEGKISVPGLMAKIIIGIFMIVPTLISAWIMIKLGLK